MKLNLGCADLLIPGYVNIDIVPPADRLVDLSVFPWPFQTDSCDEIRAHDILEHLPDKIAAMNEIHRILRDGGRLDLFVPTTDGRGAFQDPQHKSFWTPNDLFYYCEECAEWQRFRVSYGITAHFCVLSQEHSEFTNKVWKLSAVLEALK